MQALHGCPYRSARFLAFLLVATLAVLPPIDASWCPDGCGDADGVQLSMHGRSASHAGSCGLCLNGVAVSYEVPLPTPASHSLTLQPFTTPAPILVTPRPIDRPPRT